MASERQAAANRANSRRSCGPRSPEGKARASQNARKHGLFSSAVLAPGESEAELLDLEKELYAQYQPDGAVEKLLVDRVVSCVWKLRRVLAMGNGQPHSDGRSEAETGATEDARAKLSRYEADLDRAIYRALRELRILQAAKHGQNPGNSR